MPQPKRQGASPANPTDPQTGLPVVFTNVSPAQGVALSQGDVASRDYNPRAVLGTNRDTTRAGGNVTLGTPEGVEAV